MNFKSSFTLCICILVGAFNAKAQLPTNKPSAKVLLPNGWTLSPAGRSLPLGDLPLNMQLSPDKNLLAVTNNGQGKQSIQLIDPVTEKLLDQKQLVRSWYGLKFSADSKKLYVSGGNDNLILVYSVENKMLGKADTIFLGKRFPAENISPAGMDIDDKKHILYTVTKEDNTLYAIDINTKTILNKTKLSNQAYTCLLSADKRELYVSIWGGENVAIYNTQTLNLITEIKTESHPNEMLLTKNGKLLFVANASANSVSVIDVKQRKVLETISATLYPTKLTGSTTNGLALSDDEKTLYIANADNNCLAVFNVASPGKSSSLGFIPTGWYPTNVKIFGKKILVANGKGFSSLANPMGPVGNKGSDDIGEHEGSKPKLGYEYIASLFKGTLSFIDQPDAVKLKAYSKQVYANTPFNLVKEETAEGIKNNPVPQKRGGVSPIKYVFYIIKENRTYDQILGDMKEGNGDSSLCIFPESITPNQHALSRQFVLLDNFYVDAEVSADGHDWSTAAYSTDYKEKNWPSDYSGRGKSASGIINLPKDGLIWDYCKRAGISYRNYGEQMAPDKSYIKSLQNHSCLAYPGFNLGVKDVERVKIWQRDFDSLLKINALPRLNTFSMPTDHTSGQQLRKFTPTAMIAGNDLAVGQFVEYLSKSAVWKESVVFILEDDAQSGSDHIDAHRSTAYVISPYIKKGFVNHTMYSTSGMLRTMELILGLPPMSQYDAAAKPMFNCFTSTPDLSAYTSIIPSVNLDAKNGAANESAIRSAKFNLTKPDAAPDLDLNEVIWKSVKGENSMMPAPRHSAFVLLETKKKDND